MNRPSAQAAAAQTRRYDRANLLVLAPQSLVWAGTLTWLSHTDAGA
ncbi:MAG: fatty acid desaturase, partial [Burkholderia sp.]|nr:fatty acid desaturase [Burkholderia sp.]